MAKTKAKKANLDKIPKARKPKLVKLWDTELEPLREADGLLKQIKAGTTNEAWKELPLSAAGINGKVGVLLAEAGHDTLGRLAKLMQDNGQWWNKEVKGIGESGATEVADRLVAFWQEHPEFCAA